MSFQNEVMRFIAVDGEEDEIREIVDPQIVHLGVEGVNNLLADGNLLIEFLLEKHPTLGSVSDELFRKCLDLYLKTFIVYLINRKNNDYFVFHIGNDSQRSAIVVSRERNEEGKYEYKYEYHVASQSESQSSYYSDRDAFIDSYIHSWQNPSEKITHKEIYGDVLAA